MGHIVMSFFLFLKILLITFVANTHDQDYLFLPKNVLQI